uniref:Prefoldin subunit 5 n=1 Tax=Ganoderma boninense TaxID=34458 RepID=A0A5K1K300_9APHY|nr:Uncharacterized protein [Ganoderma boninense]
MASGSSAQPQQINVTDLDVPQLADVRKQLEEVRSVSSMKLQSAHSATARRSPCFPSQELSHLSNSYTQLRQAQAKFKACVENVGQVKPENKEKTILVPLTNSLYVPGKLRDLEHVIVDVGTGYYVKKVRIGIPVSYAMWRPEYLRAFDAPIGLEHSLRTRSGMQTRPQALKHYESKVEYIRTNLEALQETIQKKQENMNYLINVLQMKLQQQAGGKDSKAG